MQTIEHKYKHKLKTLRQVEELYTQLSELHVDTIETHCVFEGLINTFEQFGNVLINTTRWRIYNYIQQKKLPKAEFFMVVCCSGGKDSVATAQYYKNRGYTVVLYHMKGINPAYYDEHKAVKNIANYLDIPYYIDEIKLKGKHQYVEHPMKNMLIANGAIQFCLDNNMPVNIAFGNYNSSKLEDMDFEIDGGDSRDMWDIYEHIVSQEIPHFKIHTPLESVKDTYELFVNGNINLLPKCVSCMSPYRFRKHWKERTEKKYNIQLMENRCGCCWKCCMEYMVLVDYHLIHHEYFFSQEYYNYCFDILTKTALKETGAESATINQIWNRYFWYDITQSHLISKI